LWKRDEIQAAPPDAAFINPPGKGDCHVCEIMSVFMESK
jgi:hypothetical protein